MIFPENQLNKNIIATERHRQVVHVMYLARRKADSCMSERLELQQFFFVVQDHRRH